jgi:hypothetical protein
MSSQQAGCFDSFTSRKEVAPLPEMHPGSISGHPCATRSARPARLVGSYKRTGKRISRIDPASGESFCSIRRSGQTPQIPRFARALQKGEEQENAKGTTHQSTPRFLSICMRNILSKRVLSRALAMACSLLICRVR